jgi:acyl carrier protein
MIVSETVTEKDEFRDALLAFINHPHVTSDTALFESGLIDSLAILNLIALVEQWTERPVPPRMVVMKHFRTINAIVDTFWKEAE